MNRYLPLILVEAYLLATLAMYFFGPVHFKTHNLALFITLIFSYHFFFILGYWLSKKSYKSRLDIKPARLSLRVYYASFLLATFMVLLNYKNLMLANSIIPYDLLTELSYGILNPGLAYTERQVALADGATSGSRTLNILSIFLAFAKLFYIFLCIHFWKHLNLIKRLQFTLYCLLFLAAGFSSGTNSVIFTFFLFSASAVMAKLYLDRSRYFKRAALALGSLATLPILFFGYMMSRRGGGFDYFSSTSPLGDISGPIATPELLSFFDLVYYSWVWLNYYVVQGYYGFSLILNLDWKWTFGFGNSAFLQRQVQVITGIDISDLSFQVRISQYWDATAQWHSFYGQFANDLGLVGVVVLMFLLGFFLSRVWDSVAIGNSFYGRSLLAMFPLMFIFLPANNFVLGYLDTISYSGFCLALWVLEGRKLRFK